MSIEWTIILSLVAMIIGLIIGVSISRPTINSELLTAGRGVN